MTGTPASREKDAFPMLPVERRISLKVERQLSRFWIVIGGRECKGLNFLCFALEVSTRAVIDLDPKLRDGKMMGVPRKPKCHDTHGDVLTYHMNSCGVL